MWSLPSEIKMCRICTSNVSCGSGKIVSGPFVGEFADSRDWTKLRNLDNQVDACAHVVFSFWKCMHEQGRHSFFKIE